MKGKISAISISKKKGVKKENVEEAVLREDFGIIGDAHAGSQRQVSLLANESIVKMKIDVKAGDFAENITTDGVDLMSLAIGSRLKIGEDAILEITNKGKECHARCNIYYEAGDCIMPKEGVFAKVVKGGKIRVGEEICVVNKVNGVPNKRSELRDIL